MTIDTLDKSRIGQTLQSVRHSKKISLDISGRIRNLIKCWRQLLNGDCSSITPNAMTTKSKEPHELTNGLKNGIIKETIAVNLNGFNHDRSDNNNDNDDNYFKPKRKPDKDKTDEISHNDIDSDQSTKIGIIGIITSQIDNHEPSANPDDNTTVTQSEISPPDVAVAQNEPLSNGPIDIADDHRQPQPLDPSKPTGKPKLKSTKELLEVFCSLIDNDTKEKILADKITQEDDDPTSYHPQEFRQRELLQQQLLYHDNVLLLRSRASVPVSVESISSDSDIDNNIPQGPVLSEPAPTIATVKQSKCDKLLRQFQSLCPIQPTIVFRQMIPWKNMEKRGIDCASPCIRLTKLAKRALAADTDAAEPANKISILEIDDLLQTFEIRAQRKDMITEAISRRKESQFVDNTQSLTDISLKLKLQLQQKLPPLKIRKRKRKKKKKKRKLKVKKPIVPPVKKPRKPRIKPKPPITNFLDDVPQLPLLTEELLLVTVTAPDVGGGIPDVGGGIPDVGADSDEKGFPFCEANVERFMGGMVEGYNCTRHSQTMELLDFRKMYSLVIDKEYLHVFPWVDLRYPSGSTFGEEADRIIKSALDLPQMYS